MDKYEIELLSDSELLNYTNELYNEIDERENEVFKLNLRKDTCISQIKKRGLKFASKRANESCNISDVNQQSEQFVLFAEWLQYNGKYLLPKEQVKEFFKQQKETK